jgi:hypothetical protein
MLSPCPGRRAGGGPPGDVEAAVALAMAFEVLTDDLVLLDHSFEVVLVPTALIGAVAAAAVLIEALLWRAAPTSAGRRPLRIGEHREADYGRLAANRIFLDLKGLIGLIISRKHLKPIIRDQKPHSLVYGSTLLETM